MLQFMKPEVSSYVQDLHTNDVCESFAIINPIQPKLMPGSIETAVTVLVDIQCIWNTGCSITAKDTDHTTALGNAVHITTDKNGLGSDPGF